ncbi:Protein TIC 20-v, chloroplastic [Linum perenne]
MSALLRISPPFTFSAKQPLLPTLLSQRSRILKTSSSSSCTRLIVIAKSNGSSNSVDAGDRIISALTYFYPFFDGVQYGKYVITQFTPIQTLIQPLLPAIKVFKTFPFNSFLVFITLYFVVVRNSNFSRLQPM